MWNLQGWTTFHFFIALSLVLQCVSSFTITAEEPEEESRNPAFPHPPGSEEFKRWLEVQGEKTVQKIMDKITDPNDTMQQLEAKMAVAKYLVNVTFAAMTKRLNLGKSVSIPETASAPTTSEMPTEAAFMAMMETRAQNESDINATTTERLQEMILVLGGGNLTFPEEAIPASAPLTTTTANGTEATATTSKPLWQELLTFNFSAAFNGEGGNNLLNLSRLTNREGGSGNSLFNLSRLTGGGEGGSNLFNLSRFSGGEGGSNLFNLSRFSGGEGAGNLFNLSRFSGGEGGASSLFNLSRFSGGEGGPNRLFNISRFTSGGGSGGLSSLLNISSLAEGGLFNFPPRSSGESGMGEAVTLNPNASSSEESGVLPFVLPTPPEGFLNFPTPPPKNDSVRMSQMALGNQVEKLVGDINKNNLTGVVDSTINIATPSTVGVLVNALLNIVLCNPLDRWNGNCGV